MVLRVRDFSCHSRSQLTLCLGDNFDCGDRLLFEVRPRCDQRGPHNLTNTANRLEPLKLDRGGL
jgi:hypothetical protein